LTPYKPIPVGSQSGFILEPPYLESARRYPKHALMYSIMRKYLELIYIDQVYDSLIAQSTSATPINTYHLKFLLSRNAFFGVSCPSVVDMRIFLISNPLPTIPITNKATEINDKIGCGTIGKVAVFLHLKTVSSSKCR
jgi:hypothetical protein